MRPSRRCMRPSRPMMGWSSSWTERWSNIGPWWQSSTQRTMKRWRSMGRLRSSSNRRLSCGRHSTRPRWLRPSRIRPTGSKQGTAWSWRSCAWSRSRAYPGRLISWLLSALPLSSGRQ